MTHKFSPSINIIRDIDQPFDYIPTTNAKRIFNQLLNDYKVGIGAFNIIGSYGTGKSAFLVAMQQTLNRKKNYLEADNGNTTTNPFGATTFNFLNIVGEYTPLIKSFVKALELTDPNQILLELDHRQQIAAAKNGCLVIVIDEFGKFLEYAARHNPEEELYFIQQLAEYANDHRKQVLLITTLHQEFKAYTHGLAQNQRQEWEKVKGRLKELTFNEPVEQLLHLAGKHLKHSPTPTVKATLPDLLNLIKDARIWSRYSNINQELAHTLLPFDPLAAYILTLALQQYGQNERSLFTFLRSNDLYGLHDYNQTEHLFYNLVCVYNYLRHNYYTFLNSVYNPAYVQWSAISHAIERVEATFEDNITQAIHLVKIIGLLNIFAEQGAKINQQFLNTYCQHTLALNNTEDLLTELEQRKIIRFLNFKQSYILFEGTDLNIESAILAAAQHIDPIKDVVAHLKKHFTFPYQLAKKTTAETGTVRLFKFQLSETPLNDTPEGITDGFINLIFSTDLTLESIKTYTQEQKNAILYGWYQHTQTIKNHLFEIEKIAYVINYNRNDKIAVRELKKIQNNHIDHLNHHVLESLYDDSGAVQWIFKGEVMTITNPYQFNEVLSKICAEVYNKAPILHNELINAHYLSTAIATARKTFNQALVEHWDQADMNFDPTKSPPERTIYLSLLKDTGIHNLTSEGTYTLSMPTAESFIPLWKAGEAFLESAKISRKSLQDLVDIFSHAPYKLKDGFISFWMPIFLFAKRDSFALYHKGIYVPSITTENLDLIRKEPHKFELKTFDVARPKLDFFNKWRDAIQQEQIKEFSNTNLVETMKEFVIFYKNLPEYTKRTKQLTENTKKLRKVLATATDPEKTFFEDIPRALGHTDLDFATLTDNGLNSYVHELQESIRELQYIFRDLLDRIEKHLLTLLGDEDSVFPVYRDHLTTRYQHLKRPLLLPHQKLLHSRLISPMDKREEWIANVVQGVLNKSIHTLKDQEAPILFDKLTHTIQELDNLCDLSKFEVKENEEAIHLEITTIGKKPLKTNQILPLNSKPVVKLKKKLSKRLSGDTKTDIAALVSMLEDLLNKGN